MTDVTYEETEKLLRAPWTEGKLSRDFHYGETNHPKGEYILWKVYHNDPAYASIRLMTEDLEPIVEFTEEYNLVEGLDRQGKELADEG